MSYVEDIIIITRMFQDGFIFESKLPQILYYGGKYTLPQIIHRGNKRLKNSSDSFCDIIYKKRRISHCNIIYRFALF